MRAARCFIASLCAMSACDRHESVQSLRVFAASSLTAVLGDLAQKFESEHEACRVQLHFAGTARLFAQLSQGAQADVFASADLVWMKQASQAKMLAAPAAIVARNRLVIAVPRGNPKGIRGLRDLSDESLRLALCGPQVPAGRYARLALRGAAVKVRSLSDEPNVKALLQKLRLGEIDACMVYASDVRDLRAEPTRRDGRALRAVEALEFAEAREAIASYPVAVTLSSRHPSLAARFVSFLTSTEARSVFLRRGFLAP